ncbi:hypothetical protein L7F22_014354 [Adiantum nelumboides]|nr:hypothetical protein [Adiantum nelumboides]
MATRQAHRGNDGTEIEREPQYHNEETDLDLGRRDTEAALFDASARSSRKRIAERAQRRAHRSERSRRENEDLTDASRKSRLERNGSTRVKHRYHKQRMTEIEYDTENVNEESDYSRWKMGTGRASRRKEKSAFEQYAELKHIMEEEWGDYFPHTLKEAAKKWYYHYSASKLQVYKKLKKAFILEYTDDRGDEDILCELDRIKQGKLSVRKYVQKIKELIRRLNEPPSEKRIRAWLLSGFNSRKLREQEVPAPTKKFTELMHRALKLEQQAKKKTSIHKGRSDISTSETTET